MTTWNLQGTRCHYLICNGGSCLANRADDVTKAIRSEIARFGADRIVHTTRTLCNGRCADACVVIAYPEGVWYRQVTPEAGKQIVQKHLAGERLAEQVLYTFNQELTAAVPGAERGIAKE